MSVKSFNDVDIISTVTCLSFYQLLPNDLLVRRLHVIVKCILILNEPNLYISN